MLFMYGAMSFSAITTALGDVNFRMYSMSFVCLINIVFASGSLNHDKQYGGNVYFEGLPFSKTQIVGSKYVLGLIGASASLIIMAISTAVRYYFNDAPFSMSEVYLPIIVLAIAIISTGLSILAIYRFHYIAGMVISLGTFALFVILLILSMDKIGYSEGYAFPEIPLSTVAIVCACASLVYIVSWIFAVKVYKKQGVN